MPKKKQKTLKDRMSAFDQAVFVSEKVGDFAIVEQGSGPYLQFRAADNRKAEKGMPEICVQVDNQTGKILVQLKAGVDYSISVVS